MAMVPEDIFKKCVSESANRAACVEYKQKEVEKNTYEPDCVPVCDSRNLTPRLLLYVHIDFVGKKRSSICIGRPTVKLSIE